MVIVVLLACTLESVLFDHLDLAAIAGSVHIHCSIIDT